MTTTCSHRYVRQRWRELRRILPVDVPATFPMMYAVVYLSSKLGQVTGKGLFDVIKDHYLHVGSYGRS